MPKIDGLSLIALVRAKHADLPIVMFTGLGYDEEAMQIARKAGAIRADLDLSVVRMAIMGALNWAADWYKPGRMTPREIARDITAMALGGLATATKKHIRRKR